MAVGDYAGHSTEHGETVPPGGTARFITNVMRSPSEPGVRGDASGEGCAHPRRRRRHRSRRVPQGGIDPYAEATPVRTCRSMMQVRRSRLDNNKEGIGYVWRTGLWPTFEKLRTGRPRSGK